MKKNDLTLVYLTMNLVPWQEMHIKHVKELAEDHPLITISRLPMEGLPGIQIRQGAEQSHDKIFQMMLVAAKTATTDYIGIVEDDMLYSKDHFELRPPLDTFGYNWNRWVLFTWGEQMFSFKRRYCNGCSILPRLELIDALEERYAKWKDGIPHLLAGEVGYAKVEKALGVKVRKSVEMYSKTPVVQIQHIYGTPGYGRANPDPEKDTLDLEARKVRRRHGMMRAYEIPYWGRAEDLVKKFL